MQKANSPSTPLGCCSNCSTRKASSNRRAVLKVAGEAFDLAERSRQPLSLHLAHRLGPWHLARKPVDRVEVLSAGCPYVAPSRPAPHRSPATRAGPPTFSRPSLSDCHARHHLPPSHHARHGRLVQRCCQSTSIWITSASSPTASSPPAMWSLFSNSSTRPNSGQPSALFFSTR